MLCKIQHGDEEVTLQYLHQDNSWFIQHGSQFHVAIPEFGQILKGMLHAG
jgi:hypothetical protein